MSWIEEYQLPLIQVNLKAPIGQLLCAYIPYIEFLKYTTQISKKLKM